MRQLKTLGVFLTYENAPEKTKIVMDAIFEAADLYFVNELQVSGEDNTRFLDSHYIRLNGQCIARHKTTRYKYSRRLRTAVQKAWLVVDYVDEKLKDYDIFKNDPTYYDSWGDVKVLSDGGGTTGNYQIKLKDIIPGKYKKINGYWKKIN